MTAKSTAKSPVTSNAKQLTGDLPPMLRNVFTDEGFGADLFSDFLDSQEGYDKKRSIRGLGAELVGSYLMKDGWKIKENSNMNYSLQGLNSHIASQLIEDYWLEKVYSDEARRAHRSGDIHIHDLGSLSVYCVGWDLTGLLTHGFKGARDKIEASPAKHFRSVLGQVVNFFYTLQGEAAGAQAFSNFDTLLAPFIRYDNLSEKEVKQALQEFLFNINVPTRVGFQTPFTNVTLDVKVPAFLRDQSVIMGGVVKDKTYGEFQAEVNLFNKVFLELLLEGDAKGRVFTFPIITYNITPDFDWEAPHLSNLWEVTAKYGIPNFTNYVNSDMNPEDIRSMCCRLRIDNRKLKKRGGLFSAAPLTGSVGVVTINLPRLSYIAKDEADFFVKLKKVIALSADSLETKRALLENLTESNLYPYSKFYLQDTKSSWGGYWTNHFSTIGVVGISEVCEKLLSQGIVSKEGKQLAEKILDFMQTSLDEIQTQTGHNYNLEATPAESAAYRFVKLDSDRFPEFATPGLPYTNSSLPPISYKCDVFDLLDHQEDLQAKYSGGTGLHIFLGERICDTKALREFIKKVCSSYKIPNFTITPTFSVCLKCGYLEGEKKKCPHCGEQCEVYSRVVGYIRPVSQWNEGKQAEFARRALFEI